MIFGLTQGMNRRGMGVAHDMNPEPLTPQASVSVCAATVCRDSTTTETIPLVPCAETTIQEPERTSVDDNCEKEIK